MRVLRRLAAQRPDHQHLLGRVADVVLATDHAGDAHEHVVHGGGQVVRRRPVAARHHEVLDLRVVEGDLTTDHVVDHGLARQRHGEAPYGCPALGLEGGDLLGRVVTPSAHHRRPLVGAGLGAHGVELLGGLPRGVHRARLLQPVDALAVDVVALALAERALVPVEAHPCEHTENLGLALGRGALAVGVLQAQDELSAVMAGREPVEQRGARAAHVERSGRARREAHAERAVRGGGGIRHARQDSRSPRPPRCVRIGWSS